MDDLRELILDYGKRARAAARVLARTGTEGKSGGLPGMADEPEAARNETLHANPTDVARGEANGLSGPMLERLKLDAKKLAGMAEGVRQVARLPDPVGEEIKAWTVPNGLRITKKRVPIGVVGIIYESRPNVT